MSSKQRLNIERLSLTRGRQLLFDDLSLSVNTGESIAILGPSGVGKSTLFDLISGDLSADQGKIEVDLDHLGLLMQDGALLDHLNVIDNLNLVRRFNSSNTSKQPEEILASLNIQQAHFHERVSHLSGGERRRVAIARALVRQPQLLLLDEPDSGLDPDNIADLARVVTNQIKLADAASVAVTHNIDFASRVASRVLLLNQGKLEEIIRWPEMAGDDKELARQHRDQLERSLPSPLPMPEKKSRVIRSAVWGQPIVEVLRALPASVIGLLGWITHPVESLKMTARVFLMAGLAGTLFYFLVGAMLGSTVMAVVESLARQTIRGLLSYFIDPEFVLRRMSGAYVVYLAPAVGGMLFIARSGSIVGNWLGNISRGGQVRALRSLGVSPDQYLRSPSIVGMILSYLFCVAIFGFGIWVGSVLAGNYLFHIEDAVEAMRIPNIAWSLSQVLYKTPIYALLIGIIVSALALAPKPDGKTLSAHTTKIIIYSTVSVAVVELCFALLI